MVTVEVDEEWELDIENSNLDYKFLRLKNNQDLINHAPLGPIVRCRPLREGRVVIMGHPSYFCLVTNTLPVCYFLSNFDKTKVSYHTKTILEFKIFLQDAILVSPKVF